jgi:hypothetical protein
MPADKKVRTYDPKKVIVTFGPLIMTGYAEGTFITISRNGDLFESVRGSDGGVDRVNKNAGDFTVTLTLKQTSLSNDGLSLAVETDLRTNAGVLPLVVKDLRGTSLFVAGQAWIAKDPDDENSDSLSSREWRFSTGVATKFTGGNF